MDTYENKIPVHPIDDRYCVPEMNKIWTYENYLQLFLDSESALAASISELNPDLISSSEAQEIKNKAKLEFVKPERVKEIEKQVHHDKMAMIKALAEQCEIGAGKIHLGATSSDIVENARAIQIKQSLNLILQDAEKLKKTLGEKARENIDLVCIDRTHGQHAVPSTYGFIFAGYFDQLNTSINRITQDLSFAVGKLSGAVGTANTFVELGLDPFELQKKFLEKLNLNPTKHSRQLSPRDNFNYIFSDLTILGTILEKIASDLWNLARTEIGEVQEHTKSSQVGSSTMPHKKNPHKLERIIGMSSILRGSLVTLLELNFSHACDLKYSAADKYKFPEFFITLSYMLRLLTTIIENLVINKQKIAENINMTKGCIFAERILMALSNKGADRQKMHEHIKQLAWKAQNENKHLKELLLEDEIIKQKLTEEEITKLMDANTYIGYAKQKTKEMIE